MKTLKKFPLRRTGESRRSSRVRERVVTRHQARKAKEVNASREA